MADTDLTRAPAACGGIALGALALAGAMIAIYAGPFAPQPKPGVVLGEFAADFVASAMRGFEGTAQPAPVAPARTIDDVIAIAVSAGSVLSIVLAIVAFARREPVRLGIGALALGGAAVTFQFVTWVALLICGVILMASVINNVGALFDGFSG